MTDNVVPAIVRVEVAEGLGIDILRQIRHTDDIPRMVVEVVVNAVSAFCFNRRDVAHAGARQQPLRLTIDLLGIGL